MCKIVDVEPICTTMVCEENKFDNKECKLYCISKGNHTGACLGETVSILPPRRYCCCQPGHDKIAAVKLPWYKDNVIGFMLYIISMLFELLCELKVCAQARVCCYTPSLTADRWWPLY